MIGSKPRLLLPRKATAETVAAPRPMVVTPDYGTDPLRPAEALPGNIERPVDRLARASKPAMPGRQRDPFDGYGDRLASRPLALRLPRPIDLVIRQIAAERQVQPLRLVDQAIRDFLEKLGRLPNRPDA